MIASRFISDLLPVVQRKCNLFLAESERQGIYVLITSTYRDKESQAALYAQGRTKPGNIVTNARAGYSYHNYRCAFDFVPVINGKANWEDLRLFERCGEIGESFGLEWAGRWKTFREYCHLQYTGGLSLSDLRWGKQIPQA